MENILLHGAERKLVKVIGKRLIPWQNCTFHGSAFILFSSGRVGFDALYVCSWKKY